MILYAYRPTLTELTPLSMPPLCSGLSLLSLTFDLALMTQHYILYRNARDEVVEATDEEGGAEAERSRERQPLLRG